MNYKLKRKSNMNKTNFAIAMMLIAFLLMLISIYVPEFTTNY
ncbi:hypothetical protein [Candidatus Pelagibacter sp.]